jgi:hypothetical protein
MPYGTGSSAREGWLMRATGLANFDPSKRLKELKLHPRKIKIYHCIFTVAYKYTVIEINKV